MALTYGFFNSVEGDREYNADKISEYFKGLVSNGVFADVGDGLQVVAVSGMTVNVKRGRCIIECKWAELDEPYAVTISPASATLNRWTAVVVRVDYEEREITITTKDGTPATSPTKPTMTRNSSVFEICLAYIYVKKQATALSQANITDTRADTNICGWVTGLIKQVNTSALFIQWQTAYEEFYNSFTSWFDTLTSELQVNTYLKEFKKTAQSGSSFAPVIDIDLDMDGYEYEEGDIIAVYLNGLAAVEGVDYTVDDSSTPARIHVNVWEGQEPVWDSVKMAWDVNEVYIHVTKSKIGDPPTPSGGSTFSILSIQNREMNTNSTVVSEIDINGGSTE